MFRRFLVAAAFVVAALPTTIHAQQNADPQGTPCVYGGCLATQDDGGDHGPDPSQPLWNGVAPERCWTVNEDGMLSPHPRTSYMCIYRYSSLESEANQAPGEIDGVFVSYRSDTDSTLYITSNGCDLDGNKGCRRGPFYTQEAHDYLDGPPPP